MNDKTKREIEGHLELLLRLSGDSAYSARDSFVNTLLRRNGLEDVYNHNPAKLSTG